MGHRELTEVISLVTKREYILRAVGSNGTDKRALVDQLSVSRSTIDRGIRELETAGLIGRSSEGYCRTLFGELLLSEYDQFASTTEALLAGRELLADMPPEFEFNPALLEDATIITASQHAPHQPISALCSLFAETRWIQTVFPAVFPLVLDQWVALSDAETMRADIVLTDPVVSELVSTHRETLTQLLSEPQLSLHHVDDGPPCGLIVAETESTATAGVVVLGERGGARAFIRTDADAAVSWVRERIDHQLMQSTPLSALSND